jgi:hypothetical protein
MTSIRQSMAWMLLAPALLIVGCSRPFHLWEAHTTATPVPSSLKASTLPSEQTVILFPATFNHLQGYVPALFQALTAACSDTFPPIPVLSQYETFNKVNQQDSARGYTEEDPSFAASRPLSRHRLQQIRTTLGARYVLQPGFANVAEEMDDKFEFAGFVFLRTRANTMNLWLRLWDAETGDFLWESAGEATVAAELLNEGAAVPFHEIARKLWRHMIQEGLLDGNTTSRSFFKEEFSVEP